MQPGAFSQRSTRRASDEQREVRARITCDACGPLWELLDPGEPAGRQAIVEAQRAGEQPDPAQNVAVGGAGDDLADRRVVGAATGAVGGVCLQELDLLGDCAEVGTREVADPESALSVAVRDALDATP